MSTSCINGKKMPCSASCPFKLDISAFMLKFQKGLYSAAYKMYRDQTIFPGIVAELCPAECKNGCLRKSVDASINMPLIERSLLTCVPNKDPTSNTAMVKSGRIAVIGAGLAGLALAMRLTSRGYSVTVFEKTDRRGGVVRGMIPDDVIDAEFDLQMKYISFETVTGREIKSLDELSDFDVVCIATGAGGDDFGMRGDNAEAPFLGAKEGVFFAGSVLGLSLLEGVAQSVSFIPVIEMFLSNGYIKLLPQDDPFCEGTTTRYMKPIPPVEPADGKAYTKEEALQEAQRCPRCKCTLCRDHCLYLEKYHKLPHELDNELTQFVMGDRMFCSGNRMINSCNMCGFCAANCPSGIDVTEIARKHRRGLVDIDKMPSYADFALRDLEFSHNDARLLIKPDGDKAEYLFFPGCQLGASEPLYVIKGYKYLRDKFPSTALLLDCCSIPADWAGDVPKQNEVLAAIEADWEALGRPTVVFACGSCRATLSEHFPEMKFVSLYTIAAEDESLELRKLFEEASVFDSCGSRYDTETQDSVRKLAERSGASLEELFFSRELTKCCSHGGHVPAANPELAAELLSDRIAMSDRPYIAYCINCRDIFLAGGKPCAHILDAIWGSDDVAGKKVPTLSEKRDNRMKLKNLLLLTYPEAVQYPEKERDVDSESIRLIISDDIRRQMEKDMIMEHDIRRVIHNAETTGAKLVDEERGTFISHLQIGRITCWVEYRPMDGAFEVVREYMHRLIFV